MTVLITLTLAGGDTGPYDLYSDVDGFVTPFETSIQKIDLLAGFVSSNVPDFTTVIKLVSKGKCINFIQLSVEESTTTTTTSSTTTLTTTTTTTTIAVLDCLEYTFGTFSSNNQSIKYADCSNIQQLITIIGNGTYQEITVCAIEDSYSIPTETFLVSNNGLCSTTTTTTIAP
jgi:hypothetical protein